jgi:hypothetical protein
MAPRPRAPQALEEASDPGRRLRRRTLRVSAAMVSDIGDGRRSQRQEVGETTMAARAGDGSQIRRKRGQIIVRVREPGEGLEPFFHSWVAVVGNLD